MEERLDLRQLISYLFSYWYILLISLILGVAGGIVYHKFLTSPQYQSTATVYIRSNQKEISYNNLQLSNSLASDYQHIFTASPNLKAVMSSLHLSYDEDELLEMINVEHPADTRILKITVTSSDNEEAKKIADALAKEGMKSIRKLDGQDPYLVSQGKVSHINVGASLMEHVTLFVIGVVGLCALLIVFKFFMKKPGE
jgi:capsular polysaccharide biosynthesis protein